MKNSNRIIICVILFVVVICLCSGVMFYPKQQLSASDIHRIEVKTPTPEVYHNDCLHPCIRYSEKGFAGYHYWMAQSPYYGWNNKVENPIIYQSNCLDSIGYGGKLLEGSPLYGYNSDPCVYVDDSILYAFWRECHTPLCGIHDVDPMTVGVSSNDGNFFSLKEIFLKNRMLDGDTEQAPVLLKKDGFFYFYATWYEYNPVRKNKGIAIWKGTSLSNPDFELLDTIPFKSVLTCDKKAEIRVAGHHFYLPWPKKYDLWHFDLFEYDDKLWMVSCGEKDDNIMLSVSEDWRHFKTFRKPLVNNHYMENHVGYRQYYYKPTAFVKNDSLHVFWTANSPQDPNHNVLYTSSMYIGTKLLLDSVPRWLPYLLFVVFIIVVGLAKNYKALKQYVEALNNASKFISVANSMVDKMNKNGNVDEEITFIVRYGQEVSNTLQEDASCYNVLSLVSDLKFQKYYEIPSKVYRIHCDYIAMEKTFGENYSKILKRFFNIPTIFFMGIESILRYMLGDFMERYISNVDFGGKGWKVFVDIIATVSGILTIAGFVMTV